MSYYIVKSHAKINMALNVVGRSNSLHRIESIVRFLELHDEIKIKKITSIKHMINFTGKFSKEIKSNNTISKLLYNFEKKRLLKHKYQIIIKKDIPSKAGLGGGSMNAASILNFFVKKKLIRLKKKEIIKISNSIGSDVFLGLSSKNLILNKNNQIKNFSIRNEFYVLIVKPSFGCSTKKIYSKVKKFSKPEFDSPKKSMFSSEFLKKTKNDLELIALNQYPKLKNLKNFLNNLPNTEFVRMTGSGSAIIAYFKSSKKCKEAQKKVKKKFRNYWCKISKTI